MKITSQNLKQVQKELLSIIEDENARGLVEVAYDAYRGLPYYSETRKKVNDDVEYLISDYKGRYSEAYWIGAYVLYMHSETRKLLEDFRKLNQELKSQKEKLNALRPKYIELTDTISKLEKEKEQIDKKIDRMSNRISNLEIELDSVDDERKRNKIIKNLESLKQEYDDLVERFINIGREIKMIEKIM
jgi:chromosome segregation ATPase